MHTARQLVRRGMLMRAWAFMAVALAAVFLGPASHAAMFPFTTGTAFPWETPGTSITASNLTSATSTSVQFVDSFQPVARGDLAGLHYDRDRSTLFAIYDSSNLMWAMDVNGALIQEWGLPGLNQEGIAMAGNVLSIAEDSGAIVQYVPEPSAVVLTLGAAVLGLLHAAGIVVPRDV